MTIEFWYKYQDGGRLLTIGDFDRSPSPIPQTIYIAADGKGVQVFVDRAGQNKRPVRAAYAFEKGKWYHFALLYDPNVDNPFGTSSDGITRLYINGKQVIRARISSALNPDWANDAVIRLGGSPRAAAGVRAGPGRGLYSDLVISRGLKYPKEFTPPARSGE